MHGGLCYVALLAVLTVISVLGAPSGDKKNCATKCYHELTTNATNEELAKKVYQGLLKNSSIFDPEGPLPAKSVINVTWNNVDDKNVTVFQSPSNSDTEDCCSSVGSFLTINYVTINNIKYLSFMAGDNKQVFSQVKCREENSTCLSTNLCQTIYQYADLLIDYDGFLFFLPILVAHGCQCV